MIYDLAATDRLVCATADICIVGGGIAGLLLAVRLRDSGLRVVILESGGREQREQPHPLNDVIQLATPYRGATEGRARCLGGTSTLWGGALIPFLPEDLLERPHLGLGDWPVGWPLVQPYLAELEALFHVDDGPFDDEFVHWIGAGRYVPCNDIHFHARFAKWPTFRRRNVANLFGDRIMHDPDLHIWLNATVLDFVALPDTTRLESVIAGHASGKTIEASATSFVLCAGAIETTRLLLWLDRSHDSNIFGSCEALGRYFFDHVSTLAADIRPRQVERLNRLAGLRFVGTTMRSLRYELSPPTQRNDRVASAFGHIAVRTDGMTGFDSLRAFLQGLQKHGHIDTKLLRQVAKNLPYLAKLCAWRFAYKQLYWPRPANYELHVVVEQLPFAQNRIILGEKKDILGVPLAAIDWRLFDAESKTLAAYAQRFARFWQRHGLEEIAQLDWRFDPESPDFDLPQNSDIFHPAGTTRMGRNPRNAVVDENLKTFAVDNLWVASTAAFPSGASANPTLTLMLLTLRLADHLAKGLDAGDKSRTR
jgi:choline dehydrogenase-like flavoprotein